jgi:hypothetical protein
MFFGGTFFGLQAIFLGVVEEHQSTSLGNILKSKTLQYEQNASYPPPEGRGFTGKIWIKKRIMQQSIR